MKVLDHGLIELIDVMPHTIKCDEAIVDAARVSYSKGTTKKRDTRGLIRYLMRNWHTSPFEMVETKWLVRAPIFVARQWVRHRTASWNEESARYSEVDDNPVHLPEEWRAEHATNKQSSSGIVDMTPVVDEFGFVEPTGQSMYVQHINEARDLYKMLRERGVCREQARLACTEGRYTTWIWKIDLHNLLHFLQLRLSSHAQQEIRVYAEHMADEVQRIAPLTWEAFLCYRHNAVTFSGDEVAILNGASRTLSKSEFDAFVEKKKLLGIP